MSRYTYYGFFSSRNVWLWHWVFSTRCKGQHIWAPITSAEDDPCPTFKHVWIHHAVILFWFAALVANWIWHFWTQHIFEQSWAIIHPRQKSLAGITNQIQFWLAEHPQLEQFYFSPWYWSTIYFVETQVDQEETQILVPSKHYIKSLNMKHKLFLYLFDGAYNFVGLCSSR